MPRHKYDHDGHCRRERDSGWPSRWATLRRLGASRDQSAQLLNVALENRIPHRGLAQCGRERVALVLFAAPPQCSFALSLFRGDAFRFCFAPPLLFREPSLLVGPLFFGAALGLEMSEIAQREEHAVFLSHRRDASHAAGQRQCCGIAWAHHTGSYDS